MIINRKFKTALLTSLLTAGLVTACGEEKKEEEEEDPLTAFLPGGNSHQGSDSDENSSKLPNVGSINLTGLGHDTSSGASLTDDGEEKCEGVDGIFGLAIGAACHTAPMSSNLLLGSRDGDHNGDGELNCKDYRAAKDAEAEGKDGPGILMALMCEPVFQQRDNITKMAFKDDDGGEGNIAISFENYDGGADAVGSWSAGSDASYPADIRVWGGDDLADMSGFVALNLESKDKGVISVDGLDENMKINVAFDFDADTAKCAESPSDSNCFFQDVKLFNGSDSAGGPPNGFHLRIFADDKESPTFYALEGRYRYSKALAEASFKPDDENPCATELAKTREIYLRAVQKGSEMWGRFQFKDENGDAITCVQNGVDYIGIVGQEAGWCEDHSKEDNDGSCADFSFSHTDFDDVWEGADKMSLVKENPNSGVSWEGHSTGQELCFLENDKQECLKF